jgi:tRNA(Ile)-lysidine synthase
VIKLFGKIPRTVTVACSGGVDSMALLDFVRHNHTVTAAFFHHGTENSARAHQFLTEYCNTQGIELTVGYMAQECPAGISPEEHWRDQRYAWLDTLGPVATAHNLDDVAETWIWSSLHGTSSLMPHSRNQVLRPLLLTRKYELQSWASRKRVPFVHDASNDDVRYTRNYIRHSLMPHALRVNPGLHTMLRKKLEERGVDK